jgi:hypothetical protein
MKMPKAQTRHGDLTGKLKAELTAEHAQELEERAAQMTMATASIQAGKDEVIDLTAPKPAPEVESVGDVEVSDVVTIEDDLVNFRVNTTLEQVTIGVGNNYDFVEGQQYRAPRWVYRHLDEKGVVFH